MRHPTSASYIIPVRADGAVQAPSNAEFGRGSCTLLANTTYYYLLGGQDALIVSAHFRWDAAILLTSLTVEDSDFPEGEITGFDSGAGGEWIDEDPATAFVGVKGANVVATAGVVTNGVGGNLGGCRFNIADQAARRTRVRVAVGATGGEVVCSGWAKE